MPPILKEFVKDLIVWIGTWQPTVKKKKKIKNFENMQWEKGKLSSDGSHPGAQQRADPRGCQQSLVEPPRTVSWEPSCRTQAGPRPAAGSAGYRTKTHGIKCYSPYKWVIALERALLKERRMSVPWSYPLNWSKHLESPGEAAGQRGQSAAGLQFGSCLRSPVESPSAGPRYGSPLFQQHDFNVLSQNNFLWSWRIPWALQFK